MSCITELQKASNLRDQSFALDVKGMCLNFKKKKFQFFKIDLNQTELAESPVRLRAVPHVTDVASQCNTNK
jgi:hypothetical protein